MAVLALALGGAVVAGGAAGYALSRWRQRKGQTGMSRRDLLANVVFGGVMGFLLVALAPRMAASIHPPVWQHNVTPVTTPEELNEYVHRANGGPVLVYFYASWCVPCRAMAPNVDQLAAERRTVLTVNVDQALQLAQYYNVRSVPTIYVFNGGEITYSALGYHSLRTLRKLTLPTRAS